MEGNPPGLGLCRIRGIPLIGLSGIGVRGMSSGIGAVRDQGGIPWNWGDSGHRDPVGLGERPSISGHAWGPPGSGSIPSRGRSAVPGPLRRDAELRCRRGCARRCGWCGSGEPRARGPGSGWRRRPGGIWWI